jgi:ribose-phosphate pyrophosphokinase
MGSAKRVNAYSRIIGCPMIICHKSRERANVVGSMTAIGEVEGRNIVIVDDMVDTAGTLCKAASMLIDKGAKSVRALATHPVLSGAAYEHIASSPLEELVVTDTIPLRAPEGTDTSKIKVISVAELFGDVIDKVYRDKSFGNTLMY